MTFPAPSDNLLGMKENMNTKNLLKNFVTGNEPKRKTANLAWTNDTLYSYGHWVVAVIDRTKRTATVNINKVSNTTSRHTNALAKTLAENQFAVAYTTKM